MCKHIGAVGLNPLGVVVGVIVRQATATHVFVKIMATSWSDAEIVKLIELWGEQGIQEQLEGSKWNRLVYAKLSSELAKHGIEKSGEQCRCKVKQLRQEYKKIKDKHNETGRGRTNWKFYDMLNELLGNRLQLIHLWSSTQQMTHWL